MDVHLLADSLGRGPYGAPAASGTAVRLYAGNVGSLCHQLRNLRCRLKLSAASVHAAPESRYTLT